MSNRSSVPDKYAEKLTWFEEQEKKLPMLKQEADSIRGDPVKEFDYKRLCKQIEDIEEGKIDFLLNTMPILKKYYHYSELQGDKEDIPTQGSKKDSIQAFITCEVDDKRGELYDEYLNTVENECSFSFLQRLSIVPSIGRFCEKCKVPYVINPFESDLVCTECGFAEHFLDTENGKCLTYDQEQTSTSTVNFAYKRSNHLSEHLSCFQGKETTTIPNDIIDAIRSELKKQRITDSKKVTTSKVKEILKKLKLQKYYEHTQMITYELNGICPPSIDKNTEETFKMLFNEIQPVFDRVCPKLRKNFLSYSYVLCKLSELLNRDDLVPFFPLLKSREKLYQQDQIWKDICKELHYEFIPSV